MPVGGVARPLKPRNGPFEGLPVTPSKPHTPPPPAGGVGGGMPPESKGPGGKGMGQTMSGGGGLSKGGGPIGFGSALIAFLDGVSLAKAGKKVPEPISKMTFGHNAAGTTPGGVMASFKKKKV